MTVRIWANVEMGRTGMWDSEFGRFLKEKRRLREIPVRMMAELSGVSPGYYSDIESGRRNPPDRKTLDAMIEALNLSDTDRITFYDLAGKARSEAPHDLSEYINEYEEVRVALRLAKETGNTRVWDKFINFLEIEKGGKKDG
jgi:transcriptional regulator with XRE-family HTH domain